MELVIHWRSCLPGEQERLALLEPVLVFDRSLRLEDELNLVLAERLLLRDDERGLPCAAASTGVERRDLLADGTEIQEPELRADTEGIDRVLRGQHHGDQQQPRHQQTDACREGDPMAG